MSGVRCSFRRQQTSLGMAAQPVRVLQRHQTVRVSSPVATPPPSTNPAYPAAFSPWSYMTTSASTRMQLFAEGYAKSSASTGARSTTVWLPVVACVAHASSTHMRLRPANRPNTRRSTEHENPTDPSDYRLRCPAQVQRSSPVIM